MNSIFLLLFAGFDCTVQNVAAGSHWAGGSLFLIYPSPPWQLLKPFHPSTLTLRKLCEIFIASFKKEQEFGCQGQARKVSGIISLVATGCFGLAGCFGLGVIQSLSLRPQIHYHFKHRWFWLVSGTTFGLKEQLAVWEQWLRKVQRLPVTIFRTQGNPDNWIHLLRHCFF